uniref:Uncharacterized protein n=1 Tax=Candidatus Methanophaga sp. ANME-1 ERB7 TaxID=2759913 RepID=A0A7G9Z2H8_9EURY|nr:hypothetical protein NCOPHCNO_00013 [Methanosarcinales archaeon ANME-1 ERB7]
MCLIVYRNVLMNYIYYGVPVRRKKALCQMIDEMLSDQSLNRTYSKDTVVGWLGLNTDLITKRRQGTEI